MSTNGRRLMTPGQLAELLGVSEETLAQWRSQRRGPAYVKVEGRLVRYRQADVEVYLESCLVETAKEG